MTHDEFQEFSEIIKSFKIKEEEIANFRKEEMGKLYSSKYTMEFEGKSTEIWVDERFYGQLEEYFCYLFNIEECYGKQRKQVYINGRGWKEFDDIYTVIMSEGYDGCEWYVEFAIDDKDNLLSCDHISVNYCTIKGCKTSKNNHYISFHFGHTLGIETI